MFLPKPYVKYALQRRNPTNLFRKIRTNNFIVVEQMVWFRENWYEEVLRQLRAGLAKCHVVAFHHRAAVADATVTPHTLNFIKKVVSTFGIGIGISEFTSMSYR